MSKVERIDTCPGIDSFVRPTPESTTCSNCGSEVEIWSDEEETNCGDCGAKVSKTRPSCLQWCAFADKCKEIIQQKRVAIPS